MDDEKVDSRAFFGNQLPIAGEYLIDPVHSFAEFAVQHLIVGQVWGRFDSIAGRIRIADDLLLSSAELTIDSASVNTHHPARDADLRSERFFDVEKYPKLTFASTRTKKEQGDHFSVEGDFTLRDVTRQVSAGLDFQGMVTDPSGNARIAFQARTKLNRKDFGLLTELEKESGGFPMGSDIRIMVAVEATLRK